MVIHTHTHGNSWDSELSRPNKREGFNKYCHHINESLPYWQLRCMPVGIIVGFFPPIFSSVGYVGKNELTDSWEANDLLLCVQIVWVKEQWLCVHPALHKPARDAVMLWCCESYDCVSSSRVSVSTAEIWQTSQTNFMSLKSSSSLVWLSDLYVQKSEVFTSVTFLKIKTDSVYLFF